jgi:hypothetical protein
LLVLLSISLLGFQSQIAKLNEEYKMKVSLCLSVLMFSQTALVSPQTSNVSLPGQDWEKVAANEELEVILKNGRKVRGRLVSATDSELWFSIKKRQPAPIFLLVRSRLAPVKL